MFSNQVLLACYVTFADMQLAPGIAASPTVPQPHRWVQPAPLSGLRLDTAALRAALEAGEVALLPLQQLIPGIPAASNVRLQWQQRHSCHTAAGGKPFVHTTVQTADCDKPAVECQM
jgi:hypothetical protein